MKALVIGGDGSAHPLAWKLAQSPAVGQLFSAPGNYGTNLVGSNVAIEVGDLDALATWAGETAIDLTVVASPAALAYGVVDVFRERGLRIVGPVGAAARLQTSRAWGREFLARHGVPTGLFASFTDLDAAIGHLRDLESGRFPLLLTADDRLGSGERVLVPDRESALLAARRLLTPTGRRRIDPLVIEPYPGGFALSVLAVTDGTTTLPLGVVHPYRAAFDGDAGPLTAGMGAYSPVPGVDEALIDQVMESAIRPIIDGLASEGMPLIGVLCVEVALQRSGLQVREVDLACGALEAQVLLPRWEDDLYIVLDAAIDGALGELRPFRWNAAYSCGVVVASEGYPGEIETGYGVTGLGDLPSAAQSFHINTRNPYQKPSGTVLPKLERAPRGGFTRGLSSWIVPSRGRARGVDAQASRATGDPYSQVVTSGGPVLSVVARGRSLAEASDLAYRASDAIEFTGCWSRRDIGRLDAAWPSEVVR